MAPNGGQDVAQPPPPPIPCGQRFSILSVLLTAAQLSTFLACLWSPLHRYRFLSPVLKCVIPTDILLQVPTYPGKRCSDSSFPSISWPALLAAMSMCGYEDHCKPISSEGIGRCFSFCWGLLHSSAQHIIQTGGKFNSNTEQLQENTQYPGVSTLIFSHSFPLHCRVIVHYTALSCL